MGRLLLRFGPAHGQAKFDATEERWYPCPRIENDGLPASLGMIKTGTRLRGVVGVITVLPRVIGKLWTVPSRV